MPAKTKKSGNEITVMIETPGGSNCKFDFDPMLGTMKLKKMMPAGLVFPFDFGFIPGTIGGDGDPVDVLVISEVSTFPGCMLDCRVVGALKARQRERNGDNMRNDRIIAVPIVSAEYAAVYELAELPAHLLDQITRFFINYNEQAGKEFKPLEQLSAAAAHKLIDSARTSQLKDSLIQMFVPAKDTGGNPFPSKLYNELNEELKERFGGVTLYARAPATGLWKDREETVEDEMVIYEVMTSLPDEIYWTKLKSRLQRRFKQDEILILVSKIQKI
ncbi:inorganic diphosphatase [Pedobacter sp. SYP-B3415]|uniref:inorganic diphosphatase n=1 Tax=Pedobacter sp. SYP-B3415 TaxID=2496641 RepID=UPI0013ED8A25|nr:inorganic diphosphatase [Pedobacter sp. SYP-B3415]